MEEVSVSNRFDLCQACAIYANDADAISLDEQIVTGYVRCKGDQATLRGDQEGKLIVASAEDGIVNRSIRPLLRGRCRTQSRWCDWCCGSTT